jgi:hypothetical protein
MCVLSIKTKIGPYTQGRSRVETSIHRSSEKFRVRRLRKPGQMLDPETNAINMLAVETPLKLNFVVKNVVSTIRAGLAVSVPRALLGCPLRGHSIYSTRYPTSYGPTSYGPTSYRTSSYRTTSYGHTS